MITDTNEIRLIDFGLSKVQTGKKLEEIAGTPLYMAPEVINGSYGKEADMWSLGVLLYTLVSGFFPFYEKNTKKVFEKIRACEWEFKGRTWEKITPECRDLISNLLVYDPKKRLTG